MATVLVSNISDRANTPGTPVSIMIGGQKLRPGKSILTDDSVLNDRHRAMHGTRIWLGDLPRELTRTSSSAVAARRVLEAESATALSLEQARAYLETRTVEQLLALAASTTPRVEFDRVPSKPILVSRLGRALFQPGRELDPEAFFWLGRWSRVDGVFVPRE